MFSNHSSHAFSTDHVINPSMSTRLAKLNSRNEVWARGKHSRHVSRPDEPVITGIKAQNHRDNNVDTPCIAAWVLHTSPSCSRHQLIMSRWISISLIRVVTFLLLGTMHRSEHRGGGVVNFPLTYRDRLFTRIWATVV